MRRGWVVLGLFFFVSVGLVWLVTSLDFQEKKQIYLQKEFDDDRHFYEIAKKDLQNIANIVFHTVIDKEDIKKLFVQRRREELYHHLLPLYRYLRQFGLRQLHFHLPNVQNFCVFIGLKNMETLFLESDFRSKKSSKKKERFTVLKKEGYSMVFVISILFFMMVTILGVWKSPFLQKRLPKYYIHIFHKPFLDFCSPKS